MFSSSLVVGFIASQVSALVPASMRGSAEEHQKLQERSWYSLVFKFKCTSEIMERRDRGLPKGKRVYLCYFGEEMSDEDLRMKGRVGFR